VALILCGGKGNVSVTANIAPKLMHELCVAALAKDVEKAMAIQFQLLAVHKNLFTEANPIPVKWAAQQMGLSGGHLRLPLTSFSPEHHDGLTSAMKAAGLLK
jgi:4-hydroxy-tetrahydrodipicolinate synthase